MSETTVTCIVQGRGDSWEAFCLDFDIAVEGSSLAEVKSLIEAAVNSYVEDACAEQEPHRSRLLRRHVPLLAQLAWAAKFLLHATRRRPPSDFEGRFAIPCRA